MFCIVSQGLAGPVQIVFRVAHRIRENPLGQFPPFAYLGLARTADAASKLFEALTLKAKWDVLDDHPHGVTDSLRSDDSAALLPDEVSDLLVSGIWDSVPAVASDSRCGIVISVAEGFPKCLDDSTGGARRRLSRLAAI